MNPLTNVKNITKLNQTELKLNVSQKASWHNMYKDSAWIFIGGLDFELTEGDIITVFSQYGEVVNINLVRDKKTGKSKGFAFLCYEDQRSTVLAVDNFNGIKLVGRTIRVDHVANYKPPKDDPDADEDTRKVREEGCAPNTGVDQREKTRSRSEKKEKRYRDRSRSKSRSRSSSRHRKSSSRRVTDKKDRRK